MEKLPSNSRNIFIPRTNFLSLQCCFILCHTPKMEENAPGSSPRHITTHQPAAPHHPSLPFPLASLRNFKRGKKNHKPPSGTHEQDQILGHFLSTSWHSSLLCSRSTRLARALGLLPYGQRLNYWYYLYYSCASGPGHFCAGYCEESNQTSLCTGSYYMLLPIMLNTWLYFYK